MLTQPAQPISARFGSNRTVTKKIDSSRHVPYKGQNIEIRQSIPFAKWMDGLKDRRARVRIADRLKRLAAGNAGDSKPVGDGVQELRFAFGPGYRIYYIWSGGRLDRKSTRTHV